MEVILKRDVPKLGKKGDVLKVSDGYARNFLLPNSLAAPASESNKKDLSSKIRQHTEKEDRVYKHALEKKELLSGKAIVIKSKSGGGEKLFGSVTSQDISNELYKLGISVEKKDIHIKEPIKKLGVHEVQVKFHPKVVVSVKIEVQTI